jgi:hypothetical protein
MSVWLVLSMAMFLAMKDKYASIYLFYWVDPHCQSPTRGTDTCTSIGMRWLNAIKQNPIKQDIMPFRNAHSDLPNSVLPGSIWLHLPCLIKFCFTKVSAPIGICMNLSFLLLFRPPLTLTKTVFTIASGFLTNNFWDGGGDDDDGCINDDQEAPPAPATQGLTDLTMPYNLFLLCWILSMYLLRLHWTKHM